MLDEEAPGWREPAGTSNANVELHSTRAKEYRAFVDSHRRPPSQTSQDQEERRLHHWLTNQRSALTEGRMHQETRAAISAELPGWDAPSGRPRRAPVPKVTFEERIIELDSYLAANDGLLPPSNGGRPEEAGLGPWLRYQARLLNRGALDASRREKLDRCAPGWAGKTRNDSKWEVRAAELEAFVKSEGRLPRSTKYDDAERSLHAWLRRARDGELTEEQEAHLDASIPGWRGGPVPDSWADRVREIEEFVEQHGHFPRASGATAEESRMGYWLTRQRGARKKGKLAPEAAAMLTSALPGWEKPNPSRVSSERDSVRPSPRPLRRQSSSRGLGNTQAKPSDRLIDTAMRDVTNRYPLLPWENPFEYSNRVLRRYLRLLERDEGPK